MRISFPLVVMSLSLLSLKCSSDPGPAGNGAAGSVGAQAGASGGGATSLAGAPAVGGGGASAGALNEAGTAGVSPTAGASGSGGSGGALQATGPKPTTGCQAPDPNELAQTWQKRDITVANLPADQVAKFGMRTYYVRLPIGYDHTRLYPIVFYGPGCGASQSEPTPMMDQIKNDAIHVFLLQKDSCFSTGSYPSPEVPYFTQALNEVQGKYCTDASRVFVSGFSSGAWLSNLLACAVGDRIRAIGTAAGGLNQSIVDGYHCPGNQLATAAPVTGPTNLSGIFFTGAQDTTNPAVSQGKDGNPNGVDAARDRLIKANGCDATASEPWVNTFGANFCKIWKTGCTTGPVVYCVGPGVGHDNGSSLKISSQGFWEFWSSLP